MKPLLVRVGVAVSLSAAGYLYSHVSSRADPRYLRHPNATSGVEGGREACGGLKDGVLLHLQWGDAPLNISHGTSYATTVFSANVAGLSPGRMNPENEEGCLLPLPDLDDMVLGEIETAGMGMVSPEASHMGIPFEETEDRVRDEEISALRCLVQTLQEREKSLEIELLEYYGLKEQETAVLELDNRLKMSSVQSELLSLKMESLQAENRRLEEQASDFARTRADLESARAKIKHLKRKLRSESAQAREKVAALQQRVAALEDSECRGEMGHGETQRRLKDMEHEVAELRRTNGILAMENSDLTKKLQSTDAAATSSVKSPPEAEMKKASEESNFLRHKNDELTKEIEQLQVDRCADVEELVYLRWVNACLRYELRHYRPPPGKTIARDLSRTLSPRSEQKVKQLILEYANSGVDGKSINLMDFDSETCSSSQASSITENGDADDSSADAPTAAKNKSSSKTKFLTKLRRLVLGRDSSSGRASPVDRSPGSCGNPARRAPALPYSFNEVIERVSCDSGASCLSLDNAQGKADEQQQHESPWTQHLSRVSLDFQKLRSHGEPPETRGDGSKGGAETSWHRNMAVCEEILLGSPFGGTLDEGEPFMPPRSWSREDTPAH